MGYLMSGAPFNGTLRKENITTVVISLAVCGRFKNKKKQEFPKKFIIFEAVV